MRRSSPKALLTLLPIFTLLAAPVLWSAPAKQDAPWRRHTIDGSSRGADGVRLADVNADGRPDIVTGWEEGGITRVYLNPGFEISKKCFFTFFS